MRCYSPQRVISEKFKQFKMEERIEDLVDFSKMSIEALLLQAKIRANEMFFAVKLNREDNKNDNYERFWDSLERRAKIFKIIEQRSLNEKIEHYRTTVKLIYNAIEVNNQTTVRELARDLRFFKHCFMAGIPRSMY